LVADYFPYNHKVLKIPLFPGLFYLPGLHFWSAGIGKDAISFGAIAIFLYSLQFFKYNKWLLVLSFGLLYFTRPHIAQVLVLATGTVLLFNYKIKTSIKVLLLIIIIPLSIFLSSSTLEIMKINEFSMSSFEAFANFKIAHLSKEKIGSSIDLSSYSSLMKLFTYLYRPLFLDAHNFFSFLSSFENFIYLFLSFALLTKLSLKGIQEMPIFLKIASITFCLVTLAFMNSLANLGIILRMKNMTMIYFMLFCFYQISYEKKRLYAKLSKRKSVTLPR
jgi:hypothetical protein